MNHVLDFNDLQVIVNDISSGIADNVCLIDLRARNEVAQRPVIPGAISLPFIEVPNAIRNLSDEEFLEKYGIVKPHKAITQIVLYCNNGNLSKCARSLFDSLDFHKISIYSGGLDEWIRLHSQSVSG